QVLVFRNRRGYAPVLLCHDCGWSAHCPRCSTPERGTPMTVHAHGRRLQCHHCGLRNPAPPACPDCGGLALQPQGNGTERIEEELVRRFGEHWPVLRIDRGSTAGRDALQRHLQRLGAGPGILVGTQMLAKGHDLPQLVLVVVVGIDEGLHSADFRSGEKLAQLLIQVAGRAGRAQHPGEVLLQTHHPEHALLQTLLHGGYPAFAELELELRSATGFPPFAHLVMVRAEARETAPAGDLLQDIAALVRDAAAAVAGGGEGVQVHGPMPAPMPRRAGYQRQQLVIAADERPLLQRVLGLTMPRVYTLPAARKLRWSLDVDPVDLY
ncbi:MAG: primosomal protein N', partial [Pseudoxanthomonas suwonensis]|nr:primosomal protein N' [Pseudoxanthomonas suwonensis]